MGSLSQLHSKSYKWPDQATLDEGVKNALIRYKAEFTDSTQWTTLKPPIATIQAPLFDGDVFVITVRSLMTPITKTK